MHLSPMSVDGSRKVPAKWRPGFCDASRNARESGIFTLEGAHDQPAASLPDGAAWRSISLVVRAPPCAITAKPPMRMYRAIGSQPTLPGTRPWTTPPCRPELSHLRQAAVVSFEAG
jgi:hypothetical protein